MLHLHDIPYMLFKPYCSCNFSRHSWSPSTITQPYITIYFNHACKKNHNVTPLDWTHIKHLLIYLNRTILDGFGLSPKFWNFSLHIFLTLIRLAWILIDDKLLLIWSPSGQIYFHGVKKNKLSLHDIARRLKTKPQEYMAEWIWLRLLVKELQITCSNKLWFYCVKTSKQLISPPISSFTLE